jgi:hypothetical protein
MSEPILAVEEAPESGYTARAIGDAIFIESERLDGLHEKIRDAVRRHFDEDKDPRTLRLHLVREAGIAP